MGEPHCGQDCSRWDRARNRWGLLGIESDRTVPCPTACGEGSCCIFASPASSKIHAFITRHPWRSRRHHADESRHDAPKGMIARGGVRQQGSYRAQKPREAGICFPGLLMTCGRCSALYPINVATRGESPTAHDTWRQYDGRPECRAHRAYRPVPDRSAA